MFFKKEPLKLFRHENLYINLAGDKGRGLFCRDDIKSGTIIEVAPVMLYDDKEAALLGKTRFCDYVFAATALAPKLLKREKIKDPKGSGFLVMGAASYCNYARDPNAVPEFVDEYHTGFAILKARRDIPKDTEITIDYGISWLTHHGAGPLTRGETRPS